MGRPLDDELIRKVCQMIQDGYRNVEINRELGVPSSTISVIRNKKLYTRISDKYKMEKSGVLKEDDIKKICKMIEDGYDNVTICKKFNVTRANISDIRHGKIHKKITRKYNMSKLQLTDMDVHNICQMMERGFTNSTIARKYGVSVPSISNIRRGSSFTHITKEYNIRHNESTKRNFSDEMIHTICKMLQDGCSNNDIISRYDVSQSTVSDIRHKRSYKHITMCYDIPVGIRRGGRFSDKQIKKVCELFDKEYRPSKISKETGISISTINRIKSGNAYTHISKNYNFIKNKK